jgi:hypothetical protein
MEPYVMQLRLAVFVYMRLFQIPTTPLRKEKHDQGFWLVGDSGTLATGSDEEITGLLALLDQLIGTEKHTAMKLQLEAKKLQSHLRSLSQNFSLAIAERRLHGKCSMVTFF